MCRLFSFWYCFLLVLLFACQMIVCWILILCHEDGIDLLVNVYVCYSTYVTLITQRRTLLCLFFIDIYLLTLATAKCNRPSHFNPETNRYVDIWWSKYCIEFH